MLFNKSGLSCAALVVILLGCRPAEHRQTEDDQDLVQTDTVAADSTVLDPRTGIVYHNDSVFTGVTMDTYPDGTLSETVEYVRGKKHGTRQLWFANGQLSYQASYQHGKLHGKARTWWSNGTLRSESSYQQGVAHGVQRQWYKSGAEFKQMNLDHGVEHGLQRAWRENGKIYNNYEAKNGRIYGLKRANLCYQLEDETVLFDE